MVIYFILWIIIHSFRCSNCSLRSSFSHLLHPFDELPSLACVHVCVLSTSLLSITVRCSRFIFSISCPCSRISYFSKELWFLLWRMVLATKMLRCAHCCWYIVAPRPSQRTDQGDYMCVYVCVYITCV